ncbi:MAG: sodium/proline symporter [Clostridia bacterium]|nr:sodium/proline symporter [Clostridia bacterium]
MTFAQGCIMAVIILYLAMMIYVGYIYSRKTQNVGDFYLGGRKLGPFVTAMSAEASDMSSYLLMGLPGLAYLTGLADVGWTAIGLALGTYINWLIVARRIRVYSHELKAITIPDFFSRRFHDEKNLLTCIAAVVIVVFFVPYTASGFAACGKLFSTLFGVNYMPAMIVSAIVIVTYTSLGGFTAASTTDFIQSIFMTIALIVILFFGVAQAGGLSAVIENARSLPGYLSFGQTYDAASGAAAPYGFMTVVSTMAWGLGYFGMPHILLRFMAIEDDRKLALSRRVASVWVLVAMFVAIAIGIVGLGVVKAGAVTAPEDSETIIITLADLLSSYGFIPAIVAGIVLAGILASTMSTADSQLLAAASSVSQNLVGEVFGIKVSKTAEMLVARLTVLAIAVVGVVLARDPNSNVFKIVSFAWAGFGAAFGPVVLLALFWKRSNKAGALAGMVAGGAMVFIWKFLVRPIGGAWNIYELLPAFVVALAANVIVSLVTPEPDAAVRKEFDAVMKKCA